MFKAVSFRVSRSSHFAGLKRLALALLMSSAVPSGAGAAQIFLTSGSTWTVPSDWNSANNTIEVIGGGGGGAGSNASTEGAGGGGGGGYSKISNLPLQPGASITYRVGPGGAGGSAANAGAGGGDTYFNGSGTICQAQSVCAKGGGAGLNSSGLNAAAGGQGGALANGIGTVRYSGGAGGNSGTSSNGGGGGGGAAGPLGHGGNGGASGQNGSGAGGGGNGGGASGVGAGAGGNNNSGVGGGTAGSVGAPGGNGSGGGGGGAGYWNASAWVNNAGGSGSTGTEWDASHGSGGGGGSGAGGGGGAGAANGAAALYGAGGPGGSGNNTAGMPGASGIIVINYTPAPPPPSSATRIYLTSGSSWTVPSDWNSANNTVEVIAGGGGGAGSNASSEGAGGGGGGAYSKAVNLSLQPGASVSYRIGLGGAGGGAANAGAGGGDTYFNGTGTTCLWQSVCAKGGNAGLNSSGLNAAAGGAGGALANGVGSVRYSGGAGGNSGSSSNGGGGGGGAAGPNGHGGNGGTTGQNGSGGGGGGNGGGTSGVGGGAGGNNYVGTGGGSAGAVRVPGGVGSNGGGGGAGYWDASAWVNNAGGSGSTGSEWDATHGSGGGGGSGAGGGGGPGAANGSAGLYGAGGPGGSGVSSVGTAGAQGIIVITYTPSTGSGAGSTPVADIYTITRTSSFSYDAASGLLTQEVVEPDTPALRLQTDYVYDAFGHKQSVTVSGVDIVSRSSSSTYDARGQFGTSNTNALGQSESFQYDLRFGQPTSHTGPNGLTTTFSYDEFGRKIQVVSPDGTQTRWSYQFCSGVNGGTASCISGASYLVQQLSYAADGATVIAPPATIFYDALEREIGRQTQGFDGSIVQATKAYDALGRVTQTSRPYFANGGTPRYTTFTYDTLGRVVTTTQPDGSVSQAAFHGLTTTETNALNQTRTTVKNSQGQVVSVTDALGQTLTAAYDAVGNMVQTTDPVGNVVTASYDIRGRKISSSDPDLGVWSYTYNTLGQLTTQTDAKGQVVSMSYDKLGRTVQRVEPDMTSVWVYDTAANGIGKLASTGITSGSGNGFARSVSYDILGRPLQVATTIDGATYTMGATYDANSRLTKVSYPSGFTARYGYNSLGFANQLQDDASGQSYWTAYAMDAEGHLTQQTAGNGLVTTRGFDPLTGSLISVATGVNSTVQNQSFGYDRLGNLTSRSDANTNVSESFVYDALSRLTTSTTSVNTAPLVKTFAYSPIGNILTKSDVGTYTYPAAGQPRPHAVTSVSGGTISATFTYDANGNQTSGLGRSIVYTSYNKPASITQGARTISFVDDTDHQRVKQVTPEGTTLYIAAFGVAAEVQNPGTITQKWTDYLLVGNARVGMRVAQTSGSSTTVTTRYFHTDHLGSISAISDQNGLLVERLSYDAWGKRRNVDGSDDTTGSITSQTTRGFTDHEQLSVGGLIHMNGRVYDPLLARFTSADTVTQFPFSTQGWNRYSYVGNDPLTFTDPNGHCILGCFWNAIGKAFSSAWRAVTHFFQTNAIARSILQIALTIGMGGSPIAAGLAAAIVTGLSGGNLGDIIKAGAIAAMSTFAFQQLGGATFAGTLSFGSKAFSPGLYAANVAGSAAIGCASAVVSGASCGSGAAAAAVSAAFNPLTNTLFPNAQTDIGQRIGGTIVQAAAGGLASVAGGGKFANGAVTAAFQYLAANAAQDARGSSSESRVSSDPRMRAMAFDPAAAEAADANALREALQTNPAETMLSGAVGLAVVFGVPILAAAPSAAAPLLPEFTEGVVGNSTLGRFEILSYWFESGQGERAYFAIYNMALHPEGAYELWRIAQVAGNMMSRVSTSTQANAVGSIISLANTLGRVPPGVGR